MLNAENIISNARSWELLARRQAGETLRSVHKVDDTYIIKKFEIPLTVHSYRTPWITEYEASAKTNGEGTSHAIGYTEIQEDGNRVFYLVKEFINGRPVETFADEDIPAVAALLSTFHNNFVITDDTTTQNFIRTSDGRILFIDLGRAIIHKGNSPFFFRNVGREFAKLRRQGFKWSYSHWKLFRKHYTDKTQHPLSGWLIINTSFHISTAARCIRKIMQFKSPWS